MSTTKKDEPKTTQPEELPGDQRYAGHDPRPGGLPGKGGYQGRPGTGQGAPQKPEEEEEETKK